MARTLTILGIESSCDDTAAAIVRQSGTEPPEILSSVVAGQLDLHSAFGGVVPEIAARAHVERLDHCVEAALDEASVGLADCDAIAVTAGPGLIGGVMAGVMCAKALSAATGLPLVGVNHLAGHALTPRLTHGLDFPYLMLLISGGHCQFLRVASPDRFERLGGTIDDAPGEAFDKVAKALGLAQPGGPNVEAVAEGGDPLRHPLPRPLADRDDCDMSFSGLKTAVLRLRDTLVTDGVLADGDRANICAAFQMTVADILATKSGRALDRAGAVSAFAVAGGVAANHSVRLALESLAIGREVPFVAPPLALCTDNAAMIAWAGLERYRLGARDDMTLAARARWPLDERAAPQLGGGRRGAKA